MALSDTAGNYRCIYQKLSVFIEYHSLVGQVNLYICISDIIGISAKSTVSIRRLSHFCSSCKNGIIKPFSLCGLIDSPSVITALDSLLATIVGGKCSRAAKGIIFISQAVHISCNLIFVYYIISVCVPDQPVFDGISVKLFRPVRKIIGDHAADKLVHLVTIFFQSFIVFIYRWFFVAVFLFQTNCFVSCGNSCTDHLLNLFCIQGRSFFFRLDLVGFAIILNACVCRLFHIVLLHAFQILHSLCQLVLIFISSIRCQCIFFLLIKSKEPFVPVLFLDQLFGSAIRLVDQAGFFCGNALFSVVSCINGKNICLHFLCKKLFCFICSFIGAVKTIHLRSRQKMICKIVYTISISPCCKDQQDHDQCNDQLFACFHFFFFLIHELSPIVITARYYAY